MSYNIRRVDPDEWHEVLVDLQKEVLPDDKPLSPDIGSWFLAFHDKEPVAFGCIKPSARWIGAGYLARGGVSAPHRGHGLQRRLIKARERYALARDWTRLYSDTYIGNSESSNNLYACGFKMYVPEYEWGDGRTIYWRKYL